MHRRVEGTESTSDDTLTSLQNEMNGSVFLLAAARTSNLTSLQNDPSCFVARSYSVSQWQHSVIIDLDFILHNDSLYAQSSPLLSLGPNFVSAPSVILSNCWTKLFLSFQWRVLCLLTLIINVLSLHRWSIWHEVGGGGVIVKDEVGRKQQWPGTIPEFVGRNWWKPRNISLRFDVLRA
jgi:hypothetical protein